MKDGRPSEKLRGAIGVAAIAVFLGAAPASASRHRCRPRTVSGIAIRAMSTSVTCASTTRVVRAVVSRAQACTDCRVRVRRRRWDCLGAWATEPDADGVATLREYCAAGPGRWVRFTYRRFTGSAD